MKRSKAATLQASKPRREGNLWKWVLAAMALGIVAMLALYATRSQPAGHVDSGTSTPPAHSASAFAPTIPNSASPPGSAPEGMVWIPGGEFSMGSDDPRASICGGPDSMGDARPIHRVYVDGFWMDATEVTNRAV